MCTPDRASSPRTRPSTSAEACSPPPRTPCPDPSNHLDDSLRAAAAKPLLVGEFSATGGGREQMVRAKMQTYIREQRCCGALFWAWYGDEHNTGSYKTSHTEPGVIDAIRTVAP